MVFILIGCQQKAKIREVKSPNQNITVQFKMDQGSPYYKILYKDRQIIDWAELGLKFKNSPPLKNNLKVISTQTKKVNTKWAPVWGQKDTIINNYQQYTINLQEPHDSTRQISMIFRVYNKGIGFRYQIPKRYNFKNVKITSEETEFNLTNIDTCWWIPANYDSYEMLYRSTPLTEIDSVNTPITMRRKDGLYLSLHEADLTNYAGMTLIKDQESTTFHSDLVPWPDGTTKVKAKLPLKTPWRTIQIGENPGDLIESDLIVNLNDPNKIEDTDWIKPMKYVGIWWEMHINKSTWGQGPQHGATTKNAKNYIDFANNYLDSDNQNIGLLVEGWNIGWNGNWMKNGDIFDFTKPYSDYNLEVVVDYCQQQNVDYIMHNETSGDIINYENQMSDAYDYYQKLGIHGIKSGYVADTGIYNPAGQHHHGQYMVNHYQEAVQRAADHQIMINTHEPIKPTGVYRTYPNWMTREGVRGMEYNAWADPPNPPEHTTILPFTRILAGPVDYTPGIFDMILDGPNTNDQIYTTRAKQLAYYVVLYSPMQMIADLPQNYKEEPGLKFIKNVPSNWDDTEVITSSIGDQIVMARQSGQDWFLGGITDEQPRKINIPLDFLPQGNYIAKIYTDSISTGVYENPTAIEINKYKLRNTQNIDAALSTSGGIAIHFSPLNKDWKDCDLKSIQTFNEKVDKKYNQFQNYKIYKHNQN